jgi:hypothetical protein
MQIPSNFTVKGVGGVTDKTVNLILSDFIGRERKRHRLLVRSLPFKGRPVNCAAV